MANQNSFDSGFLAKAGFLLGVALLVVGTGGEFVGHAIWGGLPAWENTVLYYSAVIGLLSAALSPFIFGIVMPLVE